MVDRALLRVDRVSPDNWANITTNILRYDDNFMFQNDPRLVPNTYEGIGMKFDHEWHDITLVLDSDTDVFNPYIDDDGPNIVIPNFVVDFTVIVIATQAVVTERWTYTHDSVYVRDRREGTVEEGQERHTFEYEFIAYGDKLISYP